MSEVRTSSLLAPGLALALASAIPGTALAGSGKAETIPLVDDPRLEEVKADLAELFDKVEEAGLPLDLFEAKVREGLVKKVKPGKILAALVNLKKRCVAAAGIISHAGLSPSAPSIGLMADLMASGATEADAASFVEGVAGVDGGLLEQALVVAVMIRDAGSTGPEALDQTTAILQSKGAKGLDEWMKKAAKAAGSSSKAQETKEGSQDPGSKKSSKGKGKGKGKGLLKPKSPPHGK